jgi:DNA repair exonuclease SbcCD ATPase subunit
MRKVAIITGIYACITTGWLLISCELNNKSQKEEYAEEQAEATKEADKAYTVIETTDGMADRTEVRENLAETVKDLAEEKQQYVNILQDRQKKLNKRIGALDKKLTDPTQANQPQWVEQKRKLARERDRVNPMMLNLQKPMTGEKWVTAEEEIKSLLASINEQLKDNE